MQRIEGRGTHVWQYVKIVTSVTTVTTPTTKETISDYFKVSEPVVTAVTNSSALTLDDFKAVYWVEGQFGKKLCCLCGHERETSWAAETFKGEQKPLCEDCVQAFQKERG